MPGLAIVAPSSWKSYLELCKPNVVAEMLFTAIVGMLLAVPGMPPVTTAIFGIIGIALAASSAAAINNLIDQRVDEILNPHRPLPSHYMRSSEVIAFAAVLGSASMLLLILKVNTLTASLTFVSLFGYAIIYTLWLKRLTPQNIVIGGAFGATPPLLGWCAITGEVHPYALLLVLIIFVWTPPHFWPLAIAKQEKYALVNIPMLPVTHGAEFTRLQILLYAVLLFIVTLLPYLTGMSGLIYLVSAVLLGAGFIYFAVLMMHNKDVKTAMKTFWYSIVYITLLFAALLIDHYVRLTI
ncbi:heme o synthase [Methyloglobulus sp.]|uniref:heme o synthase n=1 Tax=Methyloglobulus sp. TaxID=2518622 RepID=UPI003988E16C